uniref:Uncharacterized protein n=1 Tax=Myotis myotis TaxID=51298 RepID=A0A7J7Y069_MYOMY|nr:hypothetical protein mMyoMyo1_011394 [Myotis myotis]
MRLPSSCSSLVSSTYIHVLGSLPHHINQAQNHDCSLVSKTDSQKYYSPQVLNESRNQDVKSKVGSPQALTGRCLDALSSIFRTHPSCSLHSEEQMSPPQLPAEWLSPPSSQNPGHYQAHTPVVNEGITL